MNRKLRIFLLSVLVVMLAVSSAFAALTDVTIDRVTSGDDIPHTYAGPYYELTRQDGDFFLKIKKDGAFTFAEKIFTSYDVTTGENSDETTYTASNDSRVDAGTIRIAALSFDSSVYEATLQLPTTTAGTGGSWDVSFIVSSYSSSKPAKFTILSGKGTSAIAVKNFGDKGLVIPAYVYFTINAPLIASADSTVGSLEPAFKVEANGKLTFGANADICAKSSDTTPTGYVSGDAKATYTVEENGELVIQNEWAIKGGGLSADVKGTLTLDLSGELDLRGYIKSTKKPESYYSTLTFGSGKLNVLKNISLVGALSADADSETAKVTKIGAGTLTLASRDVIGETLKKITVAAGSLVLNASPAWTPAAEATLEVSGDAKFQANEWSINTVNGAPTIDVKGTATATFENHAVYSGDNEVYYDEYDTTSDVLRINGGITLKVASGAKVVLDDAALPVTDLTGEGTVTINNSDANKDKAALIFTDVITPEDSKGSNLFAGTITGTNANVGLYGDNTFAATMFKNAALDIDNLIVYGGATLSVDEKSVLDGVDNIYLRSNRPGSDAKPQLTIGSLLFAKSLDMTDESIADFVLPKIKVDGTADPSGIATITLENGANVVLENGIEFYANRSSSTSKDFSATEAGMYAVKIAANNEDEGTLTIDGTKVTGDGLATDGIDQIRTTGAVTVEFTGNSGAEYYPIAKNNSLLVGNGGSLTVARGAVIAGNLTFGGAGSKLDTTFTTQIGKANRVTSDGGEYAVVVSGDLTVGDDGDSEFTLVAEADSDAFAGVSGGTTGQRFKVIGVNGDIDGTALTSDDVYGFRVVPTIKDGIVLQVNEELAIIELDENYTFVSGGDTFGAAGATFEIKIPVSVKIGQSTAVISRDTSGTSTHYYLGVGNDKYFIETPEVTTDNDEADIAITGSIKFGSDPDTYISLVGTTYGFGEAAVSVGVTLTMSADSDANSTLTGITGIVDGTATYKFQREGAASDEDVQYGKSETEPEGQTDFTSGEDATLSFVAKNVWKTTVPSQATSWVYQNGKYIWNVTADTDVFYMLDANGVATRVSNLKVKVFLGDYLDGAASKDVAIDDENVTVENNADGRSVTVTLPVSELGTTTSNVALRGVALAGEVVDADGNTKEILTQVATYRIHKQIAAADTIEVTELSKTVTIGGESVYGFREIYETELSGDIKYNAYSDYGSMPEWLGYTPANPGFSYQTKDLTGVTPGTYKFYVLAYNTAGDEKLYTFTITVEGAAVLTLSAPTSPVSVVQGGTGTVTLTVTGDTTSTARTFTITGDTASAVTSILDPTSVTITGNGTANITVTPGDIAAGDYAYTASGDNLTAKFTVRVTPITLDITADPNDFEDKTPTDGHTYTAVFSASAPATWTFTKTTATTSDLYSYESGEQFVVYGVAKVATDSEGDDVEQGFTVTATSGTLTQEYPVSFIVEAEDEEITYVELTPTAGSNTAVDEAYVVRFPDGVTADPSDVDLPSWLEPIYGTGDNADVVVGVKFSGVAGALSNGAKGTVRVWAYDADDNEVYYGWDVEYAAKPVDLALSLNPTAVDAVAGGSAVTSTATAANVYPAGSTVTYTLSTDLSWVTINTTTGVVTVNPQEAVEARTYSVTVIARDSRGEAGQATAPLAITVRASQPTEFTISANPSSVTFTSPTAAAQVLTLSSTYDGNVDYTATVDKTGLNAVVSGTQLTLTPSEAGTYVVTVTGDNGTTTTTTRVNVTVNEGESSTFTISASQSNVTFTSPTAAAQVLTLSSTYDGNVDYTATVDKTGLSAVVSGTQLTLTPSEVGNYVVTVTGDNGTTTAETTVNVTVNNATGTTFTITTETGGTTATVALSGTNTDIVLVPRNLVGTVSYESNASWVTVSEPDSEGKATVIIHPTNASLVGINTVTITATDSGRTTGRTDDIELTITVTGGSVGSSSGGCDAGFGALALVLATPLFLRRRRS